MQKKKSRKKLCTPHIIGSIVCLSLLMLLLYPNIHRYVSYNIAKSISYDGDITSFLVGNNYGLYQLLISDENQLDLPSNFFFEANQENLKALSGFDAYIENIQDKLFEENLSLSYYAKLKDSSKFLTNIENFEEKALEFEYGKVDLEEKYYFYVIMDYSTDGEIHILESNHGIDPLFSNRLMTENHQIKKQYIDEERTLSMKRDIQNTVYFYGIEKETLYMDRVAAGISYLRDIGYRLVVNQMQYFIGLVVAIGALLVPYERIKANRSIQRVLSIPCECSVVGTIGLLIIQRNEAPLMVNHYQSGELVWWMGINISNLMFSPILIGLLNGISWSIYFSGIIFLVWLIKKIKDCSVKIYIQRHSLLYKLVRLGRMMLNRKIEYKVQEIVGIELDKISDKGIRNNLRFVAVFLGGMCCIWFFGIIGVGIYVYVLFNIAHKTMVQLKSNYEKLFAHTRQLAEGALDTQVTQDSLGVFEPLKKHIEKIQLDFRVSIEEEIRSQQFKTDLITNVSHDLKTPLTSIVSYVELLKQKNLSETERTEYIQVLERKANRLQILIEDLFEMSKASSGNIEFNKETIEISSLIKQTLFELEDKIIKSQIQFKTHFPQEKIYLELDSVRTFRILDNLINNITKYGMQGSRAYIEVKEEAEYVIIILKNVAREELLFNPQEITERFVRGDSARSSEGSGLGLAIAKSFTELQGGWFEIAIDGDLFKVLIKFKKK